MSNPVLLTALLIFAAVALGTLSLALLLEFGQERWRARHIVQQLREFSEQTFGPESQTLIRQPRLATFLDRVAAGVPSLRGVTQLIERAGSAWTAQSYLLITFGLAVAFGVSGALFTGSLIGGAVLVPIGVLIPYLVVRRQAHRRTARLEEQLPDAIDLMGRAMRAGHPLSAGFKMVADEGPEPIAGEFRQAFEEQRFGLPFDDSLLGLANRVRLTDMRILVTAIMIHRQVGGNLAEILDNIAQMVRERFKLRRQLRVITAQGRLSGYVLGALPIILGVAIFILNREYMMPLFEQPAGRYLVVGALLFQVLGYVWIRRILDIEF